MCRREHPGDFRARFRRWFTHVHGGNWLRTSQPLSGLLAAWPKKDLIATTTTVMQVEDDWTRSENMSGEVATIGRLPQLSQLNSLSPQHRRLHSWHIQLRLGW